MFQTLIASATVGSGGATNITFSSIPQTYTDLTLAISIRSGSSNDVLFMRINGDTSATNSMIVEGNGSSVSPNSSTTNTFVRFGTITSGASASTFSSGLAYFPNYTGSALKTVGVDYVSENNATTAYQTLVGGRFPITAAITSLLISNTGSSLAEFSTAYLYGTLKGSGGATVS
jgi:hypothetical protein